MRLNLRELLSGTMRHIGKWKLPSLIGVAMTIALAAGAGGCNQGLGAFQLGVGNTPNKPPGVAFRILGQVGLPFTGIIYDSNATWEIRGSVPMSIVLINGSGLVRAIATKQSGSSGILSVQLTKAFTVTQIASTTDPFGVVSVQTSPRGPGIAPPPPRANPDVRVYVKGPIIERFNGQVEDTQTGYAVRDRAPTLILFESPNGKVDATINQVQNLGPFAIDLLVDGAVVASVSGGPSVTVREP